MCTRLCACLRARPSATHALGMPSIRFTGHSARLSTRMNASNVAHAAIATFVNFEYIIRFCAGDWVGVELDKPSGSHDGGAHGNRYFTCNLSQALPLHAILCKRRCGASLSGTQVLRWCSRSRVCVEMTAKYVLLDPCLSPIPVRSCCIWPCL